MAWTEEQLRDYQSTKFRAAQQAAPSKYRNVKVVVDGERFDSKREAQYWAELKLRQKAGEISHLYRQVPFDLCCHNGPDESAVVVCQYVADFCYRDQDDKMHVVDIKGQKETAMFKLKAKWPVPAGRPHHRSSPVMTMEAGPDAMIKFSPTPQRGRKPRAVKLAYLSADGTAITTLTDAIELLLALEIDHMTLAQTITDALLAQDAKIADLSMKVDSFLAAQQTNTDEETAAILAHVKAEGDALDAIAAKLTY